MDLPVMPPLLPMLAKSVAAIDKIPAPETFSFEPKWDEPRLAVFRS